MTVSDLERLFENEQMQAADVEAFQKMLSRNRVLFRKRLDEVEFRNEETYE